MCPLLDIAFTSLKSTHGTISTTKTIDSHIRNRFCGGRGCQIGGISREDFGFLCGFDAQKTGSKTGSSGSKSANFKTSAAVSSAGHLKFPTRGNP